MPLPAPVSTPQVNRRRPPPIDGVDASYERMVAALSGAPIAMDGSSAATATSSSSSFAIPSVSVFSALGPSSSSSAGGGGVNSSSTSNLLAVAASQNSSLTGSVAGGGGGGGTASSSAASSSPAVGGAGAGGPLGGNITAGSSSLSNNNSSSGGGGGGVGGSGGGNTTPTPSSTSSAAAAAAAANMIGGSPSATIAPTHYLQDALTDCVEHRLQHAVHYLRQYLRHQQILVMAEAAVGSSVPGAVTSIPMPTTMGSVSVPSVVSRLTGGGASTNVNTTNSSSSSVAPASSPSTNMSAQSAAAAGGRGTSNSSSGGRSVTYFDKLHRYLFQHDGARAVRSTFALFDAAFRHEHEQKIRRQLRDEEEGENESLSRQHRSSASLDTTAKTYSEAVQQGEKLFNRHQWTNAQRLTHRAALFSCFTDLFYISQRMSGQTYSPASEDSTIPSRLLFTFAATTLETHLLDVATPAVVLQCLVLVLSFMSLHVDLFSTSASTPTPAAGPHHRDTVALLTWIEQASAEKSAAMLRVLARHLEESLRCGPTTIATATTRKKRNQQQQQAQQQQIEQQQMMMLMMTSSGGGGGQPVESLLQSPADERAKELLLSRIASACGLNSAVGSSSSNSTSGPSSSSSGVSSPFAPTRAATSNASPTTNPSSDVSGGANRQKRSFTLLDFDLVLEVVRLLIQMHTRVAIPMYSMLLSRCKPSFLSPPSVPPPQNSSTDKHVGAVTDSAASSSATLGNLVLSLDDVQDSLKALSVIPGGVHAQLAEASRATTLMDEVVEHMHRVRRVLVQESVTGSGSMNHHQVGPTTAAASKPQQHGPSSSSSPSVKSSKHHNHHHSNADGSDNGGGSATSGAASSVEDVFRRGTFLDRLPYTAASSSSTSTSALKQQGGAGLGGDHCVTLSYVSGRVLLGVMRALIPPTSPSGA